MWALISGLSIFFDVRSEKQDECRTFNFEHAFISTAKLMRSSRILFVYQKTSGDAKIVTNIAIRFQSAINL